MATTTTVGPIFIIKTIFIVRREVILFGAHTKPKITMAAGVRLWAFRKRTYARNNAQNRWKQRKKKKKWNMEKSP